jgi:AbrB family looped-hinge helix DNA binding protein
LPDDKQNLVKCDDIADDATGIGGEQTMKVQMIQNGKITIPLEIRQRLGLREGAELLLLKR